ncbi:XTP/dITP diphosphatase [Thalassotalea sp. PS06]|uniref:XTP/dITP diphosphatase n=1 Tax=Thalassotalea sp. PS06 TaxID=2594005 RepID=UPI001164F344|nr:XTP/dITP diphosphatase [Thalassotalea sp. PS06]QDP02884.1 XTP/dITP diphosphatase [Thalassotalea sp. PS06]
MKQSLVLATGNPGKVNELSELLAEHHIEVLPQSDFDVPDVPETGTTFVENAIIKARHAAKCTGLPAIADDSGLEVDFLKGQPGIYSARYAGEAGNDAANNEKLMQAMEIAPENQRSARFQCVLVYMRHADDPTPVICQGTWEGSIVTEPQGDEGFGYDPLFWVDAHKCTSAELPRAVKNQLSHRGKALKQLLSHFKHLD